MVNYNIYSPYKDTNKDDFTRGVYNEIDIPFSDTDFYFEVTSEFNNKPGLLSYTLYGTPRLNWIFARFNKDKIRNLIFDLKDGMIIRVPTKERLLNYF